MAVSSLMDPANLLSEFWGIERLIESESDHKGVEFKVSHDLATDCRILACHCPACKRVWATRMVTNQMLYSRVSRADLVEIIRQEVYKFVKLVTLEVCFAVVEASELAEWLTNRVAAAGAEGIDYATLIEQALEKNKATPQGVDQMLRRMGFLKEKATIRPILPAQVKYAEIAGELKPNPKIVLPDGHPRKGS